MIRLYFIFNSCSVYDNTMYDNTMYDNTMYDNTMYDNTMYDNTSLCASCGKYIHLNFERRFKLVLDNAFVCSKFDFI